MSGVDCPCPWFHANSLSAPFSKQLSFVSPYHFRIRRDFRSKNPLSGFAPKQTKESSAWRATYIVLQRGFRVSGFLCSMYICYEHSMYVSHIRIMGMVNIHAHMKWVGGSEKKRIRAFYTMGNTSSHVQELNSFCQIHFYYNRYAHLSPLSRPSLSHSINLSHFSLTLSLSLSLSSLSLSFYLYLLTATSLFLLLSLLLQVILKHFYINIICLTFLLENNIKLYSIVKLSTNVFI